MKGYRRKKRMQKKRKILRSIYLTTFVLIFATLLYSALVIISPSIIASKVSMVYYNAKVLITNTIANTLVNFNIDIKNIVPNVIGILSNYINIFLK